jgi:Ca-activated chloride channel homolog
MHHSNRQGIEEVRHTQRPGSLLEAPNKRVRHVPGQFGGFGGVGFGGFGGRPGGEGNPFDADYGALMQISRTTDGAFYRAQDAGQLATALAKLPAAFTIVRKHIDIASAFAAGGGLLIAAAVALSLWWNRTRRMPARAKIADH